MKLKIRYKFMIILILNLGLLSIYYYVRINSVIYDNYQKYLKSQLLQSGKIVNNSLKDIREDKKRNIQALVNTPEFIHTIKNNLYTKETPFTIKKHIQDYDFENIQIYNSENRLLKEYGKAFDTENKNFLNFLQKKNFFSGIYIRNKHLIFVTSARIPNSKLLVVGKSLLDTKTAEKLKNLIGQDIAFLNKKDLLASSIREDFYHLLSEWKNDSIRIQNSLLGQKQTRFYPEKHILVLYQPLQNHEKKIIASTLIVMKTDFLTYTLEDSRKTLINILIGGMILAILVSIVFSAQITYHLNQITKWALTIQKDNLAQPISIHTNDEIQDLANVINEMMLNLKKSFDQIHEQNKKLLYLDKLKTDLITTISHEMRTPITTLYGSIEILKDGDIENKEQIQIFYSSMFTNIKLLKKMINNFIMFSTADNHIPNLIPLSLHLFIQSFKKFNLNEELKDKINEMNLNIEIILPKTPGLFILTDKDFFKTLFYELIHNAIIYNKPNGRVRVEFRQISNQKMELIIEDNGIGISEKVRKRIFERFFRGINYLETTIPGAGIGLSLVKLICEKLNYKLSIESELNRFTRVSVKDISSIEKKQN